MSDPAAPAEASAASEVSATPAAVLEMSEQPHQPVTTSAASNMDATAASAPSEEESRQQVEEVKQPQEEKGVEGQQQQSDQTQAEISDLEAQMAAATGIAAPKQEPTEDGDVASSQTTEPPAAATIAASEPEAIEAPTSSETETSTAAPAESPPATTTTASVPASAPDVGSTSTPLPTSLPVQSQTNAPAVDSTNKTDDADISLAQPSPTAELETKPTLPETSAPPTAVDVPNQEREEGEISPQDVSMTDAEGPPTAAIPQSSSAEETAVNAATNQAPSAPTETVAEANVTEEAQNIKTEGASSNGTTAQVTADSSKSPVATASDADVKDSEPPPPTQAVVAPVPTSSAAEEMPSSTAAAEISSPSSQAQPQRQTQPKSQTQTQALPQSQANSIPQSQPQPQQHSQPSVAPATVSTAMVSSAASVPATTAAAPAPVPAPAPAQAPTPISSQSQSQSQPQPQTPIPTPSQPSLPSRPSTSSSTRVAAMTAASAQTQAEAEAHARQMELLWRQKEEERRRLTWLSLPSNDHPSYYSDSDEDASSSSSSAGPPEPFSATGRVPYLSASSSLPSSSKSAWPSLMMTTTMDHNNGKRRKRAAVDVEDEELSSDSDEGRRAVLEEQWDHNEHKTGNRGSKLRPGARWIRRAKMGGYTEARNEKEVNDRIRVRIAAAQRAGIQVLLNRGDPEPGLTSGKGVNGRPDAAQTMRRILSSSAFDGTEENLCSTVLAPALLRPIQTPKALLESHTLRHTFRNPHISALSKTALDLRESEGQLSRALGKAFGAMERVDPWVADSDKEEQDGAVPSSSSTNGTSHQMNGHAHGVTRQGDARERRLKKKGPGAFIAGKYRVDEDAIGAAGTNLTADEINPAFSKLDDLFVTRGGLAIPFPSDEVPLDGASTSSMGAQTQTGPGGAEQQQQQQQQEQQPPQAVLSVGQQREVIRAALECLHELGADSLEYVERLDEVRHRLAAVKRRRAQVWEALRLWALKKEAMDEDHSEEERERLAAVAGGGVGGGTANGTVADEDETNSVSRGAGGSTKRSAKRSRQ